MFVKRVFIAVLVIAEGCYCIIHFEADWIVLKLI